MYVTKNSGYSDPEAWKRGLRWLGRGLIQCSARIEVMKDVELEAKAAGWHYEMKCVPLYAEGLVIKNEPPVLVKYVLSIEVAMVGEKIPRAFVEMEIEPAEWDFIGTGWRRKAEGADPVELMKAIESAMPMFFNPDVML